MGLRPAPHDTCLKVRGWPARKEAASTEAHVSKSWHEVQREWDAHLPTMRQKIDARKTTLDAEDAEAGAEDAENDAFYALDYAYGTIADAESAVLEAIAARKHADELAAQK